MPPTATTPSKVSDYAFTRAIDRVKRPPTRATSASSRATTTPGRSLNGDLKACLAWSGDIVQLQADNPNLKWGHPVGRRDDLDGQHDHPQGRLRLYTASVYMNDVYDPKVAAKLAAYINDVTLVKGAKEELDTDRGMSVTMSSKVPSDYRLPKNPEHTNRAEEEEKIAVDGDQDLIARSAARSTGALRRRGVFACRSRGAGSTLEA